MAGSLQFLHFPSSLAFSLCSWARFRWYSLRFSDWFLRRSYSSCFSLLASVSAGVGSGRRAGFPAFWVDLLVFFRCGLRDGFCLALVERLPALSGLGRSKVYSKVWPIAHPCGARVHNHLGDDTVAGSSPFQRGAHGPNQGAPGGAGSVGRRSRLHSMKIKWGRPQGYRIRKFPGLQAALPASLLGFSGLNSRHSRRFRRF